jgi:flagellar biosynthesis GTPase FlhF
MWSASKEHRDACWWVVNCGSVATSCYGTRAHHRESFQITDCIKIYAIQIPQLWKACLPDGDQQLIHDRRKTIAQVEAQKEKKKKAAQQVRDAKKAEKARIAAEKKAEREKLAAEKKAEKERLAAEKKAERERLAAEKKAERERLAAERAQIAAEKKSQAGRGRKRKHSEVSFKYDTERLNSHTLVLAHPDRPNTHAYRRTNRRTNGGTCCRTCDRTSCDIR